MHNAKPSTSIKLILIPFSSLGFTNYCNFGASLKISIKGVSPCAIVTSSMEVYKFGGASVSSASAIRNVADIIRMQQGQKVVVISAMGKVTNQLEDIASKYFKGISFSKELESLKEYHTQIIEELCTSNSTSEKFDEIFSLLCQYLKQKPSLNFNYEYDQIVSYGELLSTSIISAYLNDAGIYNIWVDIRNCVRTDNTYREAIVDWELSATQVESEFSFNNTSLYITQGFIAATATNQSTTLGREGSDFSAAILANLLDAKSVTIWKNVSGVLNADPVDFNDTQKLEELSYKEAIELSYSGAKVIHPKTMKPLRNKNIPLFVRPFNEPKGNGTIIHEVDSPLNLPPIFILKKNQALVTIEPNDFSFVSINELSDVFNFFKSKLIKVNLIQQSAIDFSLCIDEPEIDMKDVVEKLQERFKVRYNDGMTLATIRFYNDEAINKLKSNRSVFMEQKSRRTIKMVFK